MSNQKGLTKLFTDIIINLNILNKRLFIYLFILEVSMFFLYLYSPRIYTTDQN